MANDNYTTPVVDSPGADPAPRVGTTPPAGTTDASLAELFKQLAQESSTLIKQEIALAKAEVGESVGKATGSISKLAIAAGLALVAALVLTAFLVLLLGELLGNYWLSALIVGVVYAIVGAVLAKGAINRLKSIQYAPQTTIQTLKQDKVWAQAEVQQVKHDLTT